MRKIGKGNIGECVCQRQHYFRGHTALGGLVSRAQATVRSAPPQRHTNGASKERTLDARCLGVGVTNQEGIVLPSGRWVSGARQV